MNRHEFFQTSLISSLMDGVYEDEMSIGELLSHGSFGIGTFNALDGEMIILDGQCFQLKGDGTTRPASMSQHTPYATVTNFVPSHRLEIARPLHRPDLSKLIDNLLPSANYMYALRISGHVDWVTTRTVVQQDKPYRPMVQATDGERVVRAEEIDGIFVGFRTPVYQQGISVPGCHVHFIDDTRTRGGHVVDFQIGTGAVEVCVGTDLQLRLPLTTEFERADLAPEDLAEQVARTEHAQG
ncbi:Alpha-acetolactate decarboxylase [Acidipropionibacterium acidipropionici ATCC 4875]|uniref:Alpha-acetolactate decarboxylase n=1 Tax=Acidipropionibacterium acidipropionici (strain ATCC 4875 / DSM 20272 / JCM 6432 / NBRC 12425 / NCIMB 8070 / 4) TaxID=1171373 RepID=K7S1U9_ACIA4|nr:acetolactate decarboxylase [Acidipropionibacterium acidipropionici]AFV88552.1 Alpha-acetolactate decarboxylase [Acidipropionibacterium acidipropionici ATCC 4875]ALN14099.1 alpha-acetolactate decarboxylase [Acidipropionibacterium acidipropionici]APZ10136.1 acetolactate decarboxylase [Acidipropionibacterium acidipropionici]QCV95877.1 acetolactate decarboxylase [Acidipropionibacterium acidipropionici]